MWLRQAISRRSSSGFFASSPITTPATGFRPTANGTRRPSGSRVSNSSPISAGLWHPDATALARVRGAFVARSGRWKSARSGLSLEGDSLRRPPRGYDANHPFVEDLKRKDFISSVRLSDREVTSPRFLSGFVAKCGKMSPLPKFLAAALELPW